MDNSINIPLLLENLKIKQLNEMQHAVIGAVDEHDEVVVLSNTGSGKTLAFLLPIIKRLDADNKSPQALIMVPSRELALQIDEVFRKLGTSYKVTLCYGGHKREIEETNLIEAPALIIGTAGRLADHIRRKNFDVSTITTLVLDEFDKSLELGFLEEMEFILRSLKNVEKKILTSATQATQFPDFIQLKNPQTINFLTDGEEAANAALEVMTLHSPEKDKINTLFNFLCYANHRPCIVFCNHRDAVERVSQHLVEKGLRVAYYHGGMEQRERESELCLFKNGTSNILITTDLASRGLDIPGIRYIIHYHLPSSEDVFTHRNGRTARMHDFGTAIVLLSEEEHLPNYISGDVAEIEIPETNEIPLKTQWTTLHFSVGKKDKVNKIDIVGFLSQRGDLKKDDIGLVEVKDFYAFAAIRRSKASDTLRLVQNEKIKNKKVKIVIASSMVKMQN
ncbi:MAG TPA: DEAD/DEAH box helicase [Chitinophagaceae bacterium]|nr:DEAD/DEAH box helicase [Chitinophagaceae bacterium]